MKTALIIGAGPAGLMAAEALADAGHAVIIAEAKPSVARKLLMAGKSGLNLTKDEAFEDFLGRFAEASEPLEPMLRAFGPKDVQAWAEALGQKIFTGSTGRVFPEVMKASPLVRQWLGRLSAKPVDIRTRHRWVGRDADGFVFETATGRVTLSADCCVLACGGASWARLGSDGAWADLIDQPITPFAPANVGFVVDWSSHMQRFFGSPVKGVALHAGGQVGRGEFVIGTAGVEGGGIYEVSRALREGAALQIDLMPDVSVETIRRRLEKPRGKMSVSNFLRKTLKLDPVKQALLREVAQPLPDDLAPLIKALPLAITGPYPIDQAISTAGGLPFAALDEHLMLRADPGLFAAGEMLDWEAPTGGYLLTACLATGRWAGQGAAAWLLQQP
ncbi:TIGR03862 family flavoprotein [Cognatishimia sp. SS12]|uniref:TIGR03862 family flavoprotein n=1 Tax=Cognatishimia sp. SS12 TaxID=2979465 RepID=UPI00232C621B|nr:TIGR03862 family flavoprotein [Cognatishimia sp. SS12]MDC0737914.1 TIGR03862 family flavoprotein [Cognatishimia sp. SS12]